MTRDAYISDAFRNHLVSELPGFSDLDVNAQTRFSFMILQSVSRYRQHSQMSGWASFSYVELAENFGREKFNQLNSKLKIFEVVDDWSKIESRTKPYKLTASVEALRLAFYANPPIAPTKLLSGKGEVRHKLPRNALTAKRITVAGTEATRVGWSAASVRSKVPVNVVELRKLELEILHKIATADCGGKSGASLDLVNAGFVLDAIRTVLHHANNTIAPDCVIHKYSQSNSGRMYGQGINLQSVNRQVRYAALDGMWDYDIENCHYSILQQMVRSAGSHCSIIDDYLNRKVTIRNELAVNLGLTTRQVKEVLLAMVYGAAFSDDPRLAIPAIVRSAQAAKALYENAFFKSLAADVAKASMVVLKMHKPFRGGLRNACGLVMRTAGKKARHKLSHLLQGVESLALEAAHNLCADKILLLQHDGFTATTPNLDLVAIEAAIFDATGYRLKLSVSGPLKASANDALFQIN
jgi:hypothetical protein